MAVFDPNAGKRQPNVLEGVAEAFQRGLQQGQALTANYRKMLADQQSIQQQQGVELAKGIYNMSKLMIDNGQDPKMVLEAFAPAQIQAYAQAGIDISGAMKKFVDSPEPMQSKIEALQQGVFTGDWAKFDKVFQEQLVGEYNEAVKRAEPQRTAQTTGPTPEMNEPTKVPLPRKLRPIRSDVQIPGLDALRARQVGAPDEATRRRYDVAIDQYKQRMRPEEKELWATSRAQIVDAMFENIGFEAGEGEDAKARGKQILRDFVFSSPANVKRIEAEIGSQKRVQQILDEWDMFKLKEGMRQKNALEIVNETQDRIDAREREKRRVQGEWNLQDQEFQKMLRSLELTVQSLWKGEEVVSEENKAQYTQVKTLQETVLRGYFPDYAEKNLLPPRTEVERKYHQDARFRRDWDAFIDQAADFLDVSPDLRQYTWRGLFGGVHETETFVPWINLFKEKASPANINPVLEQLQSQSPETVPETARPPVPAAKTYEGAWDYSGYSKEQWDELSAGQKALAENVYRQYLERQKK